MNLSRIFIIALNPYYTKMLDQVFCTSHSL